VAPGGIIGFTNDNVQADSKSNSSSVPGRLCPNSLNLPGDLSRGFAPGQIVIDMFCRDCDTGVRRTPKIQRWIGLLDSPKEVLSSAYLEILACEIHLRRARNQGPPDIQEFVGEVVTIVVLKKQTISSQFHRITTGDHVDQQSAVTQAIESRGHPRRQTRRDQTRPDSDQEAHPVSF